MCDFDNKYNIVDEKTPPNVLLAGHYKRSFAYYTLRERLPVILTQVIDNLSRDKDELAKVLGEESREELKEIVGNISKLKYELQTDKEFTPLVGDALDILPWNVFLSSLNESSRSYFNACWLYSETYMYRRLQAMFEASTLFRDFDYFRKQKENALTCCVDSLELVTKSVQAHRQAETGGLKEFFQHILKLNLWGNRCDLSISAGKEIKQIGDPYNDIHTLDEYILIDETAKIWECMANPETGNQSVAFINDNSGFELFTDFLVADFVVQENLAPKVHFYVKAIPWYISDVTAHDFHWTLNYLCQSESKTLQGIGKRWKNYVEDGRFVLHSTNCFWTGPYEFYRMSEFDENLYQELADYKLLLFKGDLNYRKLIGDFNWDKTEKFEHCLRGFQPTNLCTLRTIKADLICGLKEGIAERLDLVDPTWMVTGQYGVVQFASKK